jgi:GNAT superfamily N-acetyltransferase
MNTTSNLLLKMINELLSIQEAYINMISEDAGLSTFVDSVKDAHPELKHFQVYPRGNDINLDMIAVKKEHQGAGVGSIVMDKLKNYADTNSKRILLTASSKDKDLGTTSLSRLDKFYKGHGFTPNKGRSKDFSISATHIYNPKK